MHNKFARLEQAIEKLQVPAFVPIDTHYKSNTQFSC